MHANSDKPSKEEIELAARAWAEFLYEEYMLEKHKQLLLEEEKRKIEEKSEG